MNTKEAFEKVTMDREMYYVSPEERNEAEIVVETALNRLEELEKYNVASGVGKYFNIIKYNLSEDATSDLPEALEKVHNACLKLAMIELMVGKEQLSLKKLKAFEIIKEKFVITAYILNSKNVKEYNKWLKKITLRKDYLKRILTQEEFDLLKETLCSNSTDKDLINNTFGLD